MVPEGGISRPFSTVIPRRLERGTKRQQAEVKSLDHVFIPEEAHLNDKRTLWIKTNEVASGARRGSVHEETTLMLLLLADQLAQAEIR